MIDEETTHISECSPQLVRPATNIVEVVDDLANNAEKLAKALVQGSRND